MAGAGAGGRQTGFLWPVWGLRRGNVRCVTWWWGNGLRFEVLGEALVACLPDLGMSPVPETCWDTLVITPCNWVAGGTFPRAFRNWAANDD